MTQEQFDKAVELNSKLNLVYSVKKEIEGTVTHRLSYIKRNPRESECYNSGWVMNSVNTLKAIGDILDRHDIMIRQEIDDEINKIKQEIEEL